MSPEPWTVKMSDGKAKVSPVRQRRRNATTLVVKSSVDESKTFLNDIRITLFFMKLAGLLPMYQKLSNCELAPPTIVRLMYMALVHVLSYSATGYLIYNMSRDGFNQILYSYTPTKNLNYWTEIVCWGLNYIVTLYKCSRKVKSSVKILNDIIKLDKEINQRCCANIVNKCGFAVIYFILIFACLVYITIIKILATDYPLTINAYIVIMIYSLNSGFSFLIIVYISVLFRILNARLIYLNSIISLYDYRNQAATMRQDIQALGSVQRNPLLMQNFPDDSIFTFRMYHKILRIYNAINDSYSFIIFIYMGYAFYSATTATYNLFVEITTREGISRYAMQLCFAFLILQTSLMVLLSTCCGQATNQANETANRLAKVYGTNSQHKNIINKFLIKSIRQQVNFSVCGFYTINDTTTFKIFISASIYLIILIQFKQLEESKKLEFEASMKI